MVGTAPTAALLGEDSESDPYADRILDAAIGQFAMHGIRRTSVDDVASTAKVGRVTVYRRFATKDELVRTAWVRHLRRIHAGLLAATEGLVDPLERVIEWFALGVHEPVLRSYEREQK